MSKRLRPPLIALLLSDAGLQGPWVARPGQDLLAQARSVLSSAEPFEAAKSTRRFINGAPDGSALLAPLLAVLVLVLAYGFLRFLAHTV